MKNYIAIIMAVCAIILSSCQNEDIPTGQAITFKINPSTVVSSLLENSAGDLSSIGKNQQLYVSLYIYNASGILVNSDVQQFSDYTHIMNSVQIIGAGEYTIVTSTHIIQDDGFKYWDFTGQENLSTFTVTDEGYIGGKSKILGLSAQKIHVSEETREITMNVECAGAVAAVRVMNWNRYSDVKQYGLQANKSCDNVKFDYNGQLNYSIDTKSDYAFWMALWDYKSEYNGGSGYFFMFPVTNISMTFVAVTTADKAINLGTPCTDTILKGHTYWFAYDVTEGETYWTDATEWDSYSTKGHPMQMNVNSSDMLQFDADSRSITIAR